MLDRVTQLFASRGALYMTAGDGELHPTEVRRVRLDGGPRESGETERMRTFQES